MQAIPLIALIVIFITSLWRGHAVSRSGGDNAWAFGAARGRQRLAGTAFAISIMVLAIASVLVAMQPMIGYAWVSTMPAVIGATVVIVAQIQMGSAWRVGVREGDAPLFIRHGLFGFSRNPIFVGMIVVGFSIAVSADSWWAWIALLTFIIACREQVRIEEAHLLDSFGDVYSSFCSNIPRWIGAPK